MTRYLLTRFCMMVPLILVISLIAFTLIRLSPSDPAEVALRVNAIVPTDAAIATMHHELGLDKPFWQQYLSWLKQSLHLDFGTSFVTRDGVWQELMLALPATLRLAGAALGMILVGSLSLAMLCVVRVGRWPDKVLRTLLFLLTAMPNYWTGLLLLWLVALKLDWLPVGGMTESGAVILPALTLALGYLGTYVRLLRNNMLSHLNQPYVTYAKARGLSQRRILWRHVLVNALYSPLVALGMSIPKLIAGTLVIENIFSWPGLGRLCVTAIFNRDYPVIQAYILLMALLFVVGNFLIDVLQLWLDPRLRQGVTR
ncbi:nickel ABC transporter permease subunit NikB [Prodigiosinella confusarubida]|uniref:Nickel ABC transporter permease subunit NikB n=1 Tax=Serratia sp. (strain ATCC 39006) TaxID=104623 RepID=A0A2I5TFS9_SERS3|nr:nickel/cobalt ABC transporter permease [Serratia sp. ATCC 39006]AUG99093.1 nickel ABC transporter permease subunit NikB [Serratia sp. ATCC 39006]AUH03409.1 nickel ABC transporter permease subunit NikB [Serratia sp. ATCC 39006]